ncbi:MAG: nucleotidyltransferase family protein [Saprospiraceae bacterium]|nr:nucleotidyltransferase family protein [Saprospiraceae bacterium]
MDQQDKKVPKKAIYLPASCNDALMMQFRPMEISTVIASILRKYPISRASLFGSFADGTATADSDVDLLIELSAPIGLLEFIHIKHELEDLLGRKVDLVEFKAIKPSIRDIILQSAIPVYGKEAA